MEQYQQMIPPYTDLIASKERSITDPGYVRNIPDSGINYKMAKQISELFNINHEIKLCNPNPMAAFQPGAKPTLSNYVFGGMLVSGIHPTDPSQCRMINMFESEGLAFKGKNMMMQSMINFDLDNKSNNRQLRIRSSKDEKDKASLFQEVTFSHQDTKKAFEITLAPINLAQKQGVLVSNFNYQANDKLRIGGDVKFQRAPGMTGATEQKIGATVGACFKQFDDKYLNREADKTSGPCNFAETSAKLTLADNSIMPTTLTLQHWIRSRVCNSIEALAQIDCKLPGAGSTDPMAMMMGMGGPSKGSITGKIGAAFRYPDAPKQQPFGQPPRESGNFFKCFIDSDLKIQNIIETKFGNATNLGAGIKTTYDMKNDSLQLGLGITFGEG